MSPWFNIVPSQVTTKARLFCLPFAGGGTVVYHPWRKYLLPDVELVRIQLPGRETRLRDKLIVRMEDMVSAISKEIIPLLDRPFFFFGHSMGALIAFELARELRRNNGNIPDHLFVAGRRAPDVADPEPPLHELPDKEFIDRLCQYGGIPDLLLDNKELLDLFLPILRADFEILDHYQYMAESPLECPITALGGLADPKTDRDAVKSWGSHTSDEFETHFFPGGHFFLNDAPGPLLNLINRKLRSSLLAN